MTSNLIPRPSFFLSSGGNTPRTGHDRKAAKLPTFCFFISILLSIFYLSGFNLLRLWKTPAYSHMQGLQAQTLGFPPVRRRIKNISNILQCIAIVSACRSDTVIITLSVQTGAFFLKIRARRFPALINISSIPCFDMVRLCTVHPGQLPTHRQV